MMRYEIASDTDPRVITGENFAMSNGSFNRRSFLYGASVAGFGIFAQGGTAGRGAWGRTRC